MHCVALEVDLVGSLPSGVIRELESGLVVTVSTWRLSVSPADVDGRRLLGRVGEFGFGVGTQDS